MADNPFVGTLSVTGNVGIGTEPSPNAPLYIRSSTIDNQILVENSTGALLKISLDGSEVAIGTVSGTTLPLSLKTNGSTHLSINADGNVGIGTTPTLTEKLTVNGNLKATSFLGNGATLDGIVKKAGDTMTGPLTVQNTLEVNGAIRAGNSDIYFTKTDRNHTGIGNTAGFAAIENAASHDALMILGRAGTAKGRSVKLWDYLQVNGDLDVTGKISGRVVGIGFASASVSNGQMIPVPAGFTREECVFFAAIKYLNISTNGNSFIANCTVDKNGKVNASPDGGVVAAGFAIAKKGGW